MPIPAKLLAAINQIAKIKSANQLHEARKQMHTKACDKLRKELIATLYNKRLENTFVTNHLEKTGLIFAALGTIKDLESLFTAYNEILENRIYLVLAYKDWLDNNILNPLQKLIDQLLKPSNLTNAAKETKEKNSSDISNSSNLLSVNTATLTNHTKQLAQQELQQELKSENLTKNKLNLSSWVENQATIFNDAQRDVFVRLEAVVAANTALKETALNPTLNSNTDSALNALIQKNFDHVISQICEKLYTDNNELSPSKVAEKIKKMREERQKKANQTKHFQSPIKSPESKKTTQNGVAIAATLEQAAKTPVPK